MLSGQEAYPRIISTNPHVRPYPHVHLSNLRVYATNGSSHIETYAIQLPKDPPARHNAH